jgi:hypothetical protein
MTSTILSLLRWSIYSVDKFARSAIRISISIDVAEINQHLLGDIGLLDTERDPRGAKRLRINGPDGSVLTVEGGAGVVRPWPH